MRPRRTRPEAALARRVFETWSIAIPASFAETFVDEGGYWHAYDAHRSVSLTSMLVTLPGGPVPAHTILREMAPGPGELVDVLPAGLRGWAVEADALPPARASRTLSGILVKTGRVLLATVTSDDRAWARRVWLSIRFHPESMPAGVSGSVEDRALIH